VRVAVVGTGLIGGSIGLGLARRDGWTVVGFDVDRAAALAARDRGAVDEVADDLEQAARGADLVVIAVPTDRAPEVLSDLAATAGPATVVTDVGSAKVEIVTAGAASFGDRFVGGHPMAGSERHGIEAAESSLFEEAWWILTPTAATSSEAYARVNDMATTLGARGVAIEPGLHDALVARLSHLPQLVASAIVDVAGATDKEALLHLAGAGFRDVTRIAASQPDMWVGIIRSNTEAVLASLTNLDGRLATVRAMIENGRWSELGEWLSAARTARLELFAKPDLGADPVALSMVVPDRPGVLAEVTTAAGRLGANIEDLRIVHSTEGGQGRLELVVSGTEPAEILAAELIHLGYRVHRSQIN
jgi:prephenate dehydrogenase